MTKPREFFFSVIRKMNINKTFIKWVELLFVNASSSVNFNGSPGKYFQS